MAAELWSHDNTSLSKPFSHQTSLKRCGLNLPVHQILLTLISLVSILSAMITPLMEECSLELRTCVVCFHPPSCMHLPSFMDPFSFCVCVCFKTLGLSVCLRVLWFGGLMMAKGCLNKMCPNLKFVPLFIGWTPSQEHTQTHTHWASGVTVITDIDKHSLGGSDNVKSTKISAVPIT